jgi:hypothetical protein
MTALLHFDKVLQLPLIVAHGLTGASYRALLERFSEGDLGRWPVLERIRMFFRDYARAIQNGGPEYVRSERFLNIYWPADEYMLIQLVADGDIDRFYEQAHDALVAGLGSEAAAIAPVLSDAVRLNQALLKRPFTRDTISVPLRHNIWEYYRGALVGEHVSIAEAPGVVTVNRQRQSWWSWDDYCREVIWYGNKKGAYLYGHEMVGIQPIAAGDDDSGGASEIAGIY